MHLLAPAKLNLHLRVGPRDASGFHALVSWFCTVGLFDRLLIRRSDSAGVRLTCDDPSLPAGPDNLVVRAAEALLSRQTDAGLQIKLHKRIPVGGGLGGGSSDAARSLLGVNRLLGLDLPPEELHAIAANLGSDVPFFLHGGSQICTGRGEVVTPTPPPGAKWALLILPGEPLATVDVYRKFDAIELAAADFDVQPQWTAWAQLPARPLLERLINDLEPAAFALAPRLGELRGALERTLGRVVRMSGSGSTLFTLFDERDEAESAARLVEARHSLEAIFMELCPRIRDDLSG